jgi:hypothetical protein
MEKKNLFQIARENALYKICDGCGEKKSIDEFKKTNKYCNGCPKVEEIREQYKKSHVETNGETIQGIEDINLDDFFKDL